MSGKKHFCHQCQVCGKSFNRRDVFRCHMRIHRNEKPYACNFCGKTFAHRGNRNQHAASHQEKKHFKCDYCERMFSLKIFLNRHIKNTHPENYTPSHIGHVDYNRRAARNDVFILNQNGQERMSAQHSQTKSCSVSQTQNMEANIRHNQTILKNLLSPSERMKSVVPNHQSTDNALFIGQSMNPDTMGMSVSNYSHIVQKVPTPATESTKEENIYIPQILHANTANSDDQLECHLCPMIFDKRHKYQLHIMMHELKQNEPMLEERKTDIHQTDQMSSHSGKDSGNCGGFLVPKLKGFSEEDMQTVQMIYSKTAAIHTKIEPDENPEVVFIKHEDID